MREIESMRGCDRPKNIFKRGHEHTNILLSDCSVNFTKMYFLLGGRKFLLILTSWVSLTRMPSVINRTHPIDMKTGWKENKVRVWARASEIPQIHRRREMAKRWIIRFDSTSGSRILSRATKFRRNSVTASVKMVKSG